MKDDEIATLVNEVRDIALKNNGFECLRGQIADKIVPAIRKLREERNQALSDAVLAAEWLEDYHRALVQGDLDGAGHVMPAHIHELITNINQQVPPARTMRVIA